MEGTLVLDWINQIRSWRRNHKTISFKLEKNMRELSSESEESDDQEKSKQENPFNIFQARC